MSLADIISGGSYGNAKSAATEGVNAFKDLKLPTADELKVQLTQMVNNGDMTPEHAQAILQDQSGLTNISLDPRLKQAQMDALQGLQDISSGGGLTDMDRSQLAEIQSQEAGQARGAREAILQGAEARGVGGSGLELLSQMQNQQDAATRQSARDTSVAGMAQQRALQALQGAGQLGGQIGQQQFGQQAEIAKAKDAINQFNTQNQNQFSLANQQAANQAQQFNLQKQFQANQYNTDVQNKQALANSSAVNQAAQNQIAKTSGIAGANKDVAGTNIEEGKANTGIIGAGLGAAGTAISDKNLKKDISDFDASQFLDSLTPSKYKYKNPERDGEGPQVGVMAQDVQKHLPQMVEETPNGKAIDYNKAGGPIFAMLASLHDRIKELEGTKNG